MSTPAEQARDAGLSKVAENAQCFVETMRSIARGISRKKGNVSTDDLREIAEARGIEPHHPNAWGAIFKESGWLCIGRKQSARTSNHAREIRVWCYSELFAKKKGAACR